MSSVDPKSTKRVSTSGQRRSVVAPTTTDDQRIDAAHVASRPAEQEVAAAQPSATDSDVTIAQQQFSKLQQMRVQSGQLAHYLDEVRAEQDRREAKLNARIAENEVHLRQARLWLTEQDEKLAERTKQLEQSEKSLAAREIELTATQNAKQVQYGQDRQQAEFERREATLAHREVELAEQQAAYEQAVARLRQERQEADVHARRQQQRIDRQRHEGDELSRNVMRMLKRRHTSQEAEIVRQQQERRLSFQFESEQEHQEQVAELQARQQLIEDAEALLVEGQQELDAQVRQWQAQRLRDENRLRSERRALAESQRQHQEEKQQTQASLARRGEQLESREAAQRQEGQRVAKVHRETLETRLAIEELWAKLTQAVPQPRLVAELEQIRSQLAEHFRFEIATVQQEREQLETVETRLETQTTRLQVEKEELRRWHDRRNEDIERQAARLIAREQELDRQSVQLAEQASDWDEERRTYQQEIRNLLAALRREEPVVA